MARNKINIKPKKRRAKTTRTKKSSKVSASKRKGRRSY